MSVGGVSLGHTRGENQPLETGKPLGHLAKGLAELEGTVLSLGTTLWFRDMAAALSAAGELLRAPRSSSLAQTALSPSPGWYIQGHCLHSALVQTAPQLNLFLSSFSIHRTGRESSHSHMLKAYYVGVSVPGFACFTSLILTASWKTGTKEMLLWQLVKQTQRSGDLSRCPQTCLYSRLCFPAQNSSHSPGVDIIVNKTNASPCFLNEASGAGNVLILKHDFVQFGSHQGIPTPSIYLLYLKKKI